MADAADAEVIQKLQAENKQLQAQLTRPADLREEPLTDLDWLSWSNQWLGSITSGLKHMLLIRHFSAKFNVFYRFYLLRRRTSKALKLLMDQTLLCRCPTLQRKHQSPPARRRPGSSWTMGPSPLTGTTQLFGVLWRAHILSNFNLQTDIQKQ